MRYPNRVKEVIKAKGYKQADIRGILGISIRALAYRLAGERPFAHYERRKLVKVLGVPESELFPTPEEPG